MPLHKPKHSESRSVYCTSSDNTCPKCLKPLRKCQCASKQNSPALDGIIRLSRETKGRKGKGVTLITGLDPGAANFTKTVKQLKSLCGSGGTIKDAHVELQGDHRDLLKLTLEKLGYTVKLSGQY